MWSPKSFRGAGILILLSLALYSQKSAAQCCSAGSPTGVGTHAGLVGKKTLRINTFGRFTHSRSYYKGDVKLEQVLAVEQSNFVFQGLSLSYGIINGLAIDLELGYFYLKDQTYIGNFYLKSSGLSNGLIMIKKSLLKLDTSRLSISAGLGLKFPFRLEPKYQDNVRLPIDLQTSTQALGITAQVFLKKNIIPYRLSFYFIGRYDYNFGNRDEYRYGDRLRTSFILEANLTKRLTSMFHARFEYGGYDYDLGRDELVRHTGSYIVYLSPLLMYSIASRWHLGLSADLPIYKYYNSTQLGTRYSLSLSLTRDFNLTRKDRIDCSEY